MIKISIVIPVFNEEDNILDLVNEIYKSFLSINNIFEVIVVNDGSVDNTFEKLKILEDQNKIKVINNSKNFGQSYSIKKGIENSSYDNILTIDGDGQNNPDDIKKLLKIYQEKNLHLISGIRQKRKDSYVKILSSKIANSVRSFILDDNCQDTGCSLKLFDKKIFVKIPYFNGVHRFIPALYKAFGSKIEFINVDHRPRLKGLSKYGTLDRLYRGIIDIVIVIKIIKQIKKNNV